MTCRRVLTASMAAAVVLVLSAPAAAASGRKPTAACTAIGQSDEAAFKAYRAAIDKYLTLQRRLPSEVPRFEVTTDSRHISNASDTFALSIRRARPRARQGDFFDHTAARVLSERLRCALDGVDIPKLLADINDEPTLKGPPRVYMRFPAEWSMATMPTYLLAVLPDVPEELEYRFVGHALILRDRDAALILDYVLNAIPAARN